MSHVIKLSQSNHMLQVEVVITCHTHPKGVTYYNYCDNLIISNGLLSMITGQASILSKQLLGER